MKHRSTNILVAIAITIIAVILVFILPPNGIPSRILTLPLVLVLPGYALTSALFPERTLRTPETLVFSLSLSLVIVILGGLLLNLTPFGLHASSWAVFLGGITLGACVVALIRRRGQSIFRSGWLKVANIGLTFSQGLLLGLAALIVCGAIAVSIIGAEGQSYPGFTQLWILPVAQANQKNAVRLGVSNMESTAMEYRLNVNMDGNVVKVWSSIDLSPNHTWEATLVLPQTGHAGTKKVEADLYRMDALKTIYRHVVLWLAT